jgi:hypothetical protein
MRARVALAAVFALAAEAALACPSCAVGGSTEWFRYTTVLLSIVPLLAMGGVIWWIRRQVLNAGGDGG